MDDLFKNISLKNRSKILQSLEANTTFYKKNTTIFDNVNKENLICIVLDGYIQIVKNDYNGNEIIIEKFEKGSIFGSITSPICNNEYDVITKEDSKIIIIDYNTILSIDTISSNLYNQFLKNLLLILTSKIEKQNERIEILTNKTIRNKLLAYFKIISKKTNTKVIYLPINFSELADFLVVDRSAMSREIRNLKDDNLIEVSGRKIKLFYDIL